MVFVFLYLTSQHCVKVVLTEGGCEMEREDVTVKPVLSGHATP